MKDKRNLWTLVTLFAVACILFILCGTVWNLFGQTELLPTLKVIADSATIVAALYLGMTLLGWIGSKGTFDIFGYTVGGIFRLFRKESYEKTGDTFYDYRKKKDENRKPFNWPMLAVGLLFLLISIAVTVVFLMLD
jgi:hypothetical protein